MWLRSDPNAERRHVLVGLRFGVAALVLVTCVAPIGCSCRAETEAERAARIAKQEQERLEREAREREEALRRAPVRLAKPSVSPAGADGSLAVKPGHWHAVSLGARAGEDDFDGVVTQDLVDRSDRPLADAATRRRLVSQRPMVLAGGSAKRIDSLVLVPPVTNTPLRLRSAVRKRASGVLAADPVVPLKPLMDHQYQVVVLAREPTRYAPLGALQTVTSRLPSSIDASKLAAGTPDPPPGANYLVVAPPTSGGPGSLRLPDNPLAWTGIAYVVWDDVDPELLTASQRAALVDWVAWGGQLIVSGPDSLDLLRASDLEPLLPATSSGTRALTEDELASIDSRYRVTVVGLALEQIVPIDTPWNAVRLKPTAKATSPPGLNDLIVERRWGRGRVVVTAFDLADARLYAWRAGIENFANSVLFRRPGRRFARADDFTSDNAVAALWREGDAVRLDPRRNTGVRLISRDGLSDPERFAAKLPDGVSWREADAGEFVELVPPDARGGVGAVRPFGDLPEAARAVLREAAGVMAPGASFVVVALVAYLAVLVPINWVVFAAVRRVELAWVAAPLIALGAAWLVIQQARLDIGFVRARTEVAVLELQPDGGRGVLSRYTALYASLSTTHRVEFETPAVAAPFAAQAPGPNDPPVRDPLPVVFEPTAPTRLSEFFVASASTQLLSSDEVVPEASLRVAGSSVRGGVVAGPGPDGVPRVTNHTRLALRDAVVLRRVPGKRQSLGNKPSPTLEACWLGDLAPGAFTAYTLSGAPTAWADQATAPTPFAQQRSDAVIARGGPPTGELDLDSIRRRVMDPRTFAPGELRLVALAEGVLPGMTIEPAVSQSVGAAVVVVHLDYGPLPDADPDANAPIDAMPDRGAD